MTRVVFKRIVKCVVAVSVCVAVVFTAALLLLDGNMRRILTDYATVSAAAKVNLILNDSVCEFLEEKGIDYADLAAVTYKESEVSSVNINTIAINNLKSGIVSLIQKRIGESESVKLNIPVGTVIGNEFTVNRGPDIKADMKMSGYAKSELLSDFSSAGINQTLHRIILKVSVNVYLVMPWYRASSSVEAEFILAETLIVGKVPDAYTVVIETAEEGELSGIVNDYGAQNFIG